MPPGSEQCGRIAGARDDARLHVSAGRDIANLQPEEGAAPELAVDCEVEEDEISYIALKLTPGADRPDLLHLQIWLLTRQFASRQTATPGWSLSPCHPALLRLP